MIRSGHVGPCGAHKEDHNVFHARIAPAADSSHGAGGVTTRVFVPVACMLVVAMLLSACRPSPAPSPIAEAGALPGAVWQLTYLKALPGQRDQLEQFVEQNWFVMDARAERAGYLVDNHLLRRSPADTTWDLLDISMYADSVQHAQIDSIFRTIIRPQHVVVRIDGREFRELRRFVREETLRWRAKSR